jgi:uncharacterized protein (UPF0276 family)
VLSPDDLTGAGLGLRRAHLGSLAENIPSAIEFLELAPENWIGVGGRLAQILEQIAESTTLVSHGLSLNLGGQDPIDMAFVGRLKQFLNRYDVKYYGDHLSYCAAAGQLYELLPVPFTVAAADYLAARILRVQDGLQRQIVVENTSYYCTPGQEISELDFILLVLEQADCLMLLDINNVYVNSVNHGYDAQKFIASLPRERIAYAHIAGHAGSAPEIIIDTHGAAVIEPVWNLLADAYEHFGVFATLLERDENIPPLGDVVAEIERINELQTTQSA